MYYKGWVDDVDGDNVDDVDVDVEDGSHPVIQS